MVPTSDEIIVLNDAERRQVSLRHSWIDFMATVPMPALWVSGHILEIGVPSPLVRELRANISISRTQDSKAIGYRTFLQKLLTPLNRKILRSRSYRNALAFRGIVERNPCDIDGSQLHFHFFLWERHGRFQSDVDLMNRTASSLTNLWYSKVNPISTRLYQPIDIQVITDPEVLQRVAFYELKANPLTESYELFDDWRSGLKYAEPYPSTADQFRKLLNNKRTTTAAVKPQQVAQQAGDSLTREAAKEEHIKMTATSIRTYGSFVGFRASKDLNDRLQRLSGALGRHKSDVIRYLLVRCLAAYEADGEAIARIRRELH